MALSMNGQPITGTMVGAGFFAEFQAEAWSRIQEGLIAAVADLDVSKAETFARRHGIPRFYGSVDQMLETEKPAFVDIATRPEAHLQLVQLAAEQNIHVICQKPMAPTWSECIAMCEACEKQGVRLLIHENWRWQPWYREARRLLQRGLPGRMVQITFQWRTGDGRGPEPYSHQPYFRQMPKLLIYETLVHILDTFRFLGGEIEEINCRIRRNNFNIAGEDQALIHLQFENGVLGLIDANRITGPMPPPVAMGQMLLEGEERQLKIDPQGHLFVGEHDGRFQEHSYSIPDRGYKGDSVYATQVHLLNSLRENAPCESEGREYLKTVDLVERCYRCSALA